MDLTVYISSSSRSDCPASLTTVKMISCSVLSDSVLNSTSAEELVILSTRRSLGRSGWPGEINF